MKSIFVDHISLMAPGLESWPQAQQVLRGEAPYQPQPLPPLTPSLLPANERRRITTTIKLALQLAQDALQEAAVPAAEVQAVFASSAGDSDITDRLCRALALPERPVSPIHFHNSVHNAPAGYWAIAVASRAASTSVAAGSGTFAAGLLEAATQVLVERAPVLLVAYDAQPPAALMAPSGVRQSFGLAMLLMPQAGAATLGELSLALGSGSESACTGELERLRLDNPIARSLPLLTALARGEGTAVLPCLEGTALTVTVRPC